MDFLTFYIVSTIVTLLVMTIIIKATINSMSRTYSTFKTYLKKITLSEKAMYLLPLLIPCLNCLIALVFLCGGFLLMPLILSFVATNDAHYYRYRR